MSGQVQTRPDTLLVREALRGARHFFRLAAGTIQNSFDPELIPGPASTLAGLAKRGFGALSSDLDEVLSEVAHRVIGIEISTIPNLQLIAGEDKADEVFAAVMYVALNAALHHLGARHPLVSEVAAQNAFAATTRVFGEQDSRFAARLTLKLHGSPSLCVVENGDELRVPAGELRAIAIFAVMLWLLAERNPTDDAAALEAAVEMSVALERDIVSLSARSDVRALGDLYAKYAPHV